MIEQIIKYLSPIALLGFAWGIVQFYQKRAHLKSDLIREEKRNTFKEIDTVINNIKNEYWLLFATMSQIALELETLKIDPTREKKIKENKNNFSKLKVIIPLKLVQ